jgi:AraC-like DNA-binding protein
MQYPLDKLQFRVLQVFLAKESGGWEIPSRQNPYAALWFVAEGQFSFSMHRDKLDIGRGAIVLIPPDTPFQAAMAPDVTTLSIIGIRFRLMTEDNYDFLRLFRFPTVLHIDESAAARETYFRLVFLQRQKTAVSRLLIGGLFQYVFGSLLARNLDHLTPVDPQGRTERMEVFRAVRWMENRLHEVITLEDIAETASVSANHLNYLFRTTTNMSPIRYLNYLRIQRSKELLLQTNMPVNEICEKVGIRDPYYFSRLFKKMEQLSPTRYRELKPKI